jgi:hypothetical protein
MVEARNRNLSVKIGVGNEEVDFASSRAAIFWAMAPAFRVALEKFTAVDIVRALDEGLLVIVVVADEACLAEFNKVVDKRVIASPAGAGLLIKIGLQEHEVCELAARHMPGPALNNTLEICSAAETSIDACDDFLLRRAFHDCKSITLQRLTGGLSGASAFLVEATLSTSLAGARPAPYFAKLDDSRALKAEHDRYTVFGEHHIPWHLRPNFQPSRSVFGVDKGVLVGSFVQAADSLWQRAIAGEGVKYIRTLFDETLIGWLKEAECHSSQPAGSVISALMPFCNHTRVPASRVAMASEFGNVAQPSGLWRAMLDLAPEAWRKSVIHGDMHPENVRVRKDDAIVIDFAKATRGPICADLASLEVWLVFQIPSGQDLPPTSEWVDLATQLYDPRSLLNDGEDVRRHDKLDWIVDSVAEVRRIASKLAVGPEEYSRVLACYLLRHATFEAGPLNLDEDEFRRTFAYWLANKIISHLGARPEVAAKFP